MFHDFSISIFQILQSLWEPWDVIHGFPNPDHSPVDALTTQQLVTEEGEAGCLLSRRQRQQRLVKQPVRHLKQTVQKVSLKYKESIETTTKEVYEEHLYYLELPDSPIDRTIYNYLYQHTIPLSACVVSNIEDTLLFSHI